MNKITRMWVDQPSSHQIHHEYHGKNVLAVPPVLYGRNGDFIRVYFVEGSVISMNMRACALSEGWYD